MIKRNDNEMKEQIYKIDNLEAFEPKHIFECGQCFRWNKQVDGSYTGVVKEAVLNVKKEENTIIVSAMMAGDIEVLCREYFDLETDYTKIKEQLSKVDENLRISIQYGSGIRILKQDLWETLISFIISANNNIPRIKGIIERIAKNYGRPISWKNNIYYTFPTPDELGKASVEDLRSLGLGFRDKRVWETTQKVLSGEINLEALENENDVEKLREELLKIPGVGPKVADCIMLFALKKLEVFPIDVWVRRVMNELYIKQEDETKVNKKQIQKLARRKICKFSWNCTAILVLLEERSLKKLT